MKIRKKTKNHHNFKKVFIFEICEIASGIGCHYFYECDMIKVVSKMNT